MNAPLESQQLPAVQDPRWLAVMARDPAADGKFYYSVRTTGVYCLPSCAARTPRPENVRFHATREEAEQAGFRPCKRCLSHRDSGAKPVIRFAPGQTLLGQVLVAQSARGLCAVLLGDDPEVLRTELHHRFPGSELVEDPAALSSLVSLVADFVMDPRGELETPLDLRGSEFQREVWQALTRIPCGTTTTYSQVAAQVQRPKAVRAVAQACAANALAVVIPCHRVVRSDGSLSGYRWGVDRKRLLLQREGRS